MTKLFSPTPLKDSRTPSQSSTKASGRNNITRLNFALPHRFIQSNGDRSSRGIAVVGEIADELCEAEYSDVGQRHRECADSLGARAASLPGRC
jgi:hypothetical protein